MLKKGFAWLAAALTALSASAVLPRPAAAAQEKKLIALTFDDGPNTTTTNEVLDLLEQYGAKGSFFLIGDNINEQSAVSVRRAYDMGMEIDNHSKTHSNMSKMTADELAAEIGYVDEKVLEITGEKTKFFRPPFIDVSQSMYDAIDLPFICGIDCQDYMENVTAQERADYILNGAKDGVIVLLHDAAGNSQTVEALKIAMPELVKQGYEFVTLTELFARQGESPKHNILYSSVAKYPCDGWTLYQEAPAEAADKVTLDRSVLAALGDSYAIEVEYDSPTGYAPVAAIQKWSSTPSIWKTVDPFYFNGEKAVFLASDINAALDSLGVTLEELDGLSLTAFSGAITLANAKILVPGEVTEPVAGDADGDGVFGVADALTLHKWLLAIPGATVKHWTAADLDGDGKLTGADLTLMKRMLLEAR